MCHRERKRLTERKRERERERERKGERERERRTEAVDVKTLPLPRYSFLSTQRTAQGFRAHMGFVNSYQGVSSIIFKQIFHRTLQYRNTSLIRNSLPPLGTT